MKFNNNTLLDHCTKNHISLLKDYINEHVNRDSYIDFNCVECSNPFSKNFRQIIKTGAYCQSCMSKIASHKIKLSSVKYDVTFLLEFCNNNNILLTDDYSHKYINRNSLIEGICKNNFCDNIFEKPFRQLIKINGFCHDCSVDNGKEKIKNIMMNKYGVTSGLKVPEIREKIKQTTLLKYNVEHNSQSSIIKQKKKDTNLKKYGCEFTLQIPEIRDKIKQTNIFKYGHENPQQNNDIKNKTIATTLKKYGFNHFSQTAEFKEKVIKTNLERYGVPHHSQNPEVSENMIKNAYNKKPYILPSGNTILLQGYENFMLDYLLKVEKINEDDIFTKRADVPEIWYNDKTKKRHRHYVDFYIKSQNRCIEVKSTFTNQSKNNVFEKQHAAKDLGFIYEVWIFNKCGDILEKYN